MTSQQAMPVCDLQYPPRPTVTDALRKQIVKEVTEDLISPRELSNRHNLTVEKVVTMPDLKLATSKTIDHSQRGQEAMLDARQRMAAAGGAQGIFCALFFQFLLLSSIGKTF